MMIEKGMKERREGRRFQRNHLDSAREKGEQLHVEEDEHHREDGHEEREGEKRKKRRRIRKEEEEEKKKKKRRDGEGSREFGFRFRSFRACLESNGSRE